MSIFAKFSRRSKNIKFVEVHIFGRIKITKIWKTKKMREKNMEIMEKSSPIRMAHFNSEKRESVC